VADESSDLELPVRMLSSWRKIADCLEAFPSPETSLDVDYGVHRTAWVFRGAGNASYELQPAVERGPKRESIEWHALEILVSDEFKSRLRMHLAAPGIPEDNFSWLALMQHHGVPTRLLDFTYSPFVALYFAVRQYSREPGRHGARNGQSLACRLWAIDAAAVNSRFRDVAHRAIANKHGKRLGGRVRLDPDSLLFDRDQLIDETLGWRRLIEELLPARGSLLHELDRQECVCAALPPALNPRLASQQGVFMLNLAGGLGFKKSLDMMMAPRKTAWCKKFDIAETAIPEIEQKLFQMNIHEQSLFPDMQGLAELIRQKLRLHWK
jgi:hypothetical protein